MKYKRIIVCLVLTCIVLEQNEVYGEWVPVGNLRWDQGLTAYGMNQKISVIHTSTGFTIKGSHTWNNRVSSPGTYEEITDLAGDYKPGRSKDAYRGDLNMQRIYFQSPKTKGKNSAGELIDYPEITFPKGSTAYEEGEYPKSTIIYADWKNLKLTVGDYSGLPGQTISIDGYLDNGNDSDWELKLINPYPADIPAEDVLPVSFSSFTIPLDADIGYIYQDQHAWVDVLGAPTSSTYYDDYFNVCVVPEPATLVLLGLGGLMVVRRRRGSY
jgi:hypothetical protein